VSAQPSPPGRERRSRRAVAAVLDAVEAMGEGRPSRLAISEALGRAGELGPKERRHVAAASRGVVRWLRACDAALTHARAPRCPPGDRALLRYLAWRLAVLGEPAEPALRDLALPGPRRPRTLSDAQLRQVAEVLPRPSPAGPASVLPDGTALARPRDPAVALGLRCSVPDLFAAKLLEALSSAEAEACLDALNREPQIALRVNASRGTRDAVLAQLQAAGVVAEAGEDPLAVRVGDRAGLFDAAPFRQGLVEVQDESSQAVIAACRPAAGEGWLDLCAGSGGKALALAALGAAVTAWDASPRRLAELPRRTRRARLVITVGQTLPSGPFDGVLVDAPCSGSGALQREPDARWRIDAEGLRRYAAAQDEVLALGAERVVPGGALVYSTCSLFQEEGEARIASFLANRPAFGLELEERRWPHRQPGAGFYIARLRHAARNSPAPRPKSSRPGAGEGRKGP
jgi:16S rRNA (cytosine967-C5)-methyltransferase